MKTLNDLQALIDTNRHALNLRKQQIDIWAENGKLKPGTGKENENGIHVQSREYQIALEIERMASEKADFLTVIIGQFVENLDQEHNRNTIEPDFSITVISHRLVDIEITFTVTDAIYLTPDEDSIIEINGVKMAPGTHTLNVAETAKVTGAIK